MRFLHCGDLHLGCTQFGCDQRQDDFFDTFGTIVDLAILRKVDCMLIAGDLFHHRTLQAYTLERATQLLRPLQELGIAVLLTEGNHDKAYYTQRRSWLDFLCAQNLIQLLIDGEVTSVQDCRIVGYGYLGGSAAERLQGYAQALPPCDTPTIALLHAGVDRLLSLDMSGIRKSDLDGFAGNVDYFAMGHIHGRYEIDNWIFNGGAPECVHISEVKHKEKGVYIGDIQPGTLHTEFVPIPTRSFFSLPCPGNIDEQFAQLDQLPLQGAVLQICLPYEQTQSELRALAERLKERYNCLYVEVTDSTQAAEQSEAMQGDDMAQVELEVFMKMAQEQGFDDAQTVSRLLIGLKNDLLHGDSPAQIFSNLHKSLS